MPYAPHRHHRRSIRLPTYDYSRPGAYFVTLCTQHRVCRFGEVREGRMYENAYGQVVRDVWRSLPDRYATVATDAFVVMPNHVHGIIIITAGDDPDGTVGAIHVGAIHVGAIHVGAIHVGAIHESPLRPPDDRVRRRRMLLPRVIGYWKMNTARRINTLCGTPGRPVWQRNYYEHVIRNARSLERIRRYIRENPARWSGDSLYAP